MTEKNTTNLDVKSSANHANHLHALTRQALAKALDYAMDCGDLLAKVKDQLPHGQFIPWIRDNCDFGDRAARGYIRLAKNRATLEAKRQSVADLGIGSALKLLSERTNKARTARTPACNIGPHSFVVWFNDSWKELHSMAVAWPTEDTTYLRLAVFGNPLRQIATIDHLLRGIHRDRINIALGLTGFDASNARCTEHIMGPKMQQSLAKVRENAKGQEARERELDLFCELLFYGTNDEPGDLGRVVS